MRPQDRRRQSLASLNAVNAGLTGRTVPIRSDDDAEYQSHALAYEKDFKPAGPQERDLVQSIADSVWRLQRIRCLEQAFFSKGRVEFAEMFSGNRARIRLALVELHTFETYEKGLRNLSFQESRLSRRRGVFPRPVPSPHQPDIAVSKTFC